MEPCTFLDPAVGAGRWWCHQGREGMRTGGQGICGGEDWGQVGLRSWEKSSRPHQDPARGLVQLRGSRRLAAGKMGRHRHGGTRAEPRVRGQTMGHDWWLEVCWEEGRRRKPDPEKRSQRSRRRHPLRESHRLGLGPCAGRYGDHHRSHRQEPRNGRESRDPAKLHV